MIELLLILDRSGSMNGIQTEAVGAINAFLAEQRLLDGEAMVTVYTFDTEVIELVRCKPLNDMPDLSYGDVTPRGMTALYDAIGKAIDTSAERYADHPVNGVACVISTDGHENASKEYSKQQIMELLQRHRDEFDWDITFIGAGEASWGETNNFAGVVNKTTNITKAAGQTTIAYASASDDTAAYRARKGAE